MQKVTPITKKRELYSDFFIDFIENPVSQDLARQLNEDAVKSSIRNLLFTNKGERLYQPQIGGDIQKLLFESATPDTFITIREIIQETLYEYEPRANVIGVDVLGNVDSNEVQIVVVFNVINSQEEITLVQTISRVR